MISLISKKSSRLLAFIVTFIASSAIALVYEVPPSTTGSYAPYISDSAMEQCVRLYNKAKWLIDEIDKIQVNQYSQSSVDSYNSKVTRHSKMINNFNQGCAGKQSESAYRAAQKLNKR
ncbi:MAG TPA: hypothetical protein EYQ76_03620 [Candidatus Marinimicrobia bacterium]|jgi:hypothetical protein|nr:hypothetical protein [Candidatus Neomarinimicrobiota bacterium]HIL87076.1 hypothetical protein [Candidatus Neomarinimicrobiota bacterium]